MPTFDVPRTPQDDRALVARVSAMFPSFVRTMRAAALSVAAASLTGCLTRTLWDTPTPEPYLSVQFDAGPTTRTQGEVVVGGPGLVFRGAGGDPVLALRPGADAGAMLGLIGRSGLFEVVQVEVLARSTWLRDLHVGDTVEVALSVVLQPGALGEVVAPGELTPEAEAVLANGRRPGFFVDDVRFVPSAFRDCVDGLAGIDVTAWVGREGTVESFVFVGADGRPAFGADGDLRDVRSGVDGAMPTDERLELLATRDLIVRVRCDDERVDLRLAPDRVWLASCLEWRGDVGSHRSWWLPVAQASGTAVPGATWPAELVRSHQRFERFVRHTPGMELWQKLALTPITFAIDLVLGPILGPAWDASRRHGQRQDR